MPASKEMGLSIVTTAPSGVAERTWRCEGDAGEIVGGDDHRRSWQIMGDRGRSWEVTGGRGRSCEGALYSRLAIWRVMPGLGGAAACANGGGSGASGEQAAHVRSQGLVGKERGMAGGREGGKRTPRFCRARGVGPGVSQG